MKPINLHDFEMLAAEKLSAMAHNYYVGGADDEITVSENVAAYKRLHLLPRVLRGVGTRTMQTKLLGDTFSMPIGIAPTALQKLAHPDGELAMARAAQRVSAPMILSTTATVGVEEVLNTVKTPIWFQLYMFQYREAAQELVRRAESAGARAIVLTVDTPYLGKREREIRTGFHTPPGVEVPNYRLLMELFMAKAQAQMQAAQANTAQTQVAQIQTPQATVVKQSTGASGLADHFSDFMEHNLTWKDVEWLCSITTLPVVIKGIVRADDAVLAREHGAQAVIVSNHGGRQLDTCIPTIEALPAIAEAVNDSMDVYVDGGIRRGTDVLKALALGAKAVFVGRPALWGLAADGENGAVEVLTILQQEFDLAMALCGCRTLDEITPDVIKSTDFVTSTIDKLNTAQHR